MSSETFSCNSLMQSFERMIVFLIHFLPSFEKIKLPLRYSGNFFNCFSFWEVGCAKIFVKSFCLYMTQRYSSNFFQLPTEGVSHHTHHLDSKLFFCLFCHFIHIFFFHLFSKSLIDYYQGLRFAGTLAPPGGRKKYQFVRTLKKFQGGAAAADHAAADGSTDGHQI